MASSDRMVLFTIIPGAWHPYPIYEPLISQLQSAGYDAVVIPYPSTNSSSPTTATCAEDAKAVQQQLTSLIEDEGKNIVVIGHSYGGIPTAGGAYGLSVTTRAQEGKKGGILGLVYISAFVVPEGTSLLTFLGGKHAPYLVPDTPIQGMSTISPSIETLFNDIDPSLADRLAATLVPHAMLAFESPAPPSVWTDAGFEGKFAFIRCVKDQALPTFVQDMFVGKSGVEWKVRDVDAGHSPYLSRPKELREALVELAVVFAS